MLPGVDVDRPIAPRRAAGGQRSGATSSAVPDELVVELLEAGDQQLDAGLVGEDLAGRGEIAPNTPRRTGSKNNIALAPSARYGRLASRK